MIPSWLNDVVAAFGRQMGLRNFDLGERGVASVRFENGVRLKFEYAQSSLIVSVSVEATMENLTAALTLANYRSRSKYHIRVALFERANEVVLAVRIPEREADAYALEGVFSELWNAQALLGGGK